MERHAVTAFLLAGIGAAAIASAAPALAAPSEADRAKVRAGSSRAACLWRRRDCYPPARLWYRVSLRFRGTFRWEGRADHPLRDFRVPADRADSGLEIWELRSNTAVRLTLSCADIFDLRRKPVLATRRINGKRRTIGGCPRNARRGLRPSVNFDANASGELSFFSWRIAMAPGAGSTHRCEGWSFFDIFTSSHGLLGRIASRSSLTEGLELGWSAAPPTAGRRVHHDEVRCAPLNGGNALIAVREQDNERDDGHYAPGLGVEYVYAGGARIPWRPAPWLVRFDVRAANFGGAYIIQRKVRQPQRDPGSPSYVRPPTPPYYEHWSKDYTYTLRLEPCPDRGLDVERC